MTGVRLPELVTAIQEAAAPLGLRVTADPAALLPPALLIDPVPTLPGPGPCGWVRAWRVLLIPAASTDHLAAAWLDEHIEAVLDALFGVGQVADPVEPATFALVDDDTPAGVPAYHITLTT